MKQYANSQESIPENAAPAQAERFAIEQALHLYSAAPANIIAGAIATILLPFILWEQLDHTSLLLWTGVQVFVLLLRIPILFIYWKNRTCDENGERWKRWYLSSLILTGLLWGWAGFFLFPERSIPHQLYFILLLVGSAAVVSLSYRINLHTYAAFSFPIFISLLAKLLIDPTFIHGILSAGLILLQIFLIWGLRQRNKTFRESLELALENLNLRDHLAAEEEQIEALNTRLQAERNQLRTLVDNLPAHIFVKDTESRFLLINKSSLLALNEDEANNIIGKTDFDLFPREIAQKYYQDEQKVIKTGQALINQEVHSIDLKTGLPKWRLASKIPFRDNHGNIAGLVGITSDITERKLREETFRQHNRELILLNHMSDLLQTCEIEAKTYHIVKSICSQIFATDAGCLYMLDSNQAQFARAASWGTLPGAVKTLSPETCRALTRETNYCIADKERDPICPQAGTDAQKTGYICASIATPEDLMGLLYLRFSHYEEDGDSCNTQKELIESKRLMATRVVRHYALFLSNLRLRETLRMEAIHDPLTQLYNRRYMEESLSREIKHAKRQNSSIGIMLFDVDHFKRFNDTYGHVAGDIVLQTIARFIKTHIRVEDIPCRYGGEEFLLIFPETLLPHLQERAEELRAGIAALETAYQGAVLNVTISAGVAAIPTHGQKISHAIKAADTALYQAKHAGRNQVVTASNP